MAVAMFKRYFWSTCLSIFSSLETYREGNSSLINDLGRIFSYSSLWEKNLGMLFTVEIGGRRRKCSKKNKILFLWFLQISNKEDLGDWFLRETLVMVALLVCVNGSTDILVGFHTVHDKVQVIRLSLLKSQLIICCNIKPNWVVWQVYLRACTFELEAEIFFWAPHCAS